MMWLVPMAAAIAPTIGAERSSDAVPVLQFRMPRRDVSVLKTRPGSADDLARGYLLGRSNQTGRPELGPSAHRLSTVVTTGVSTEVSAP